MDKQPDEPVTDDMAKTPFPPTHGLSNEEHKWLTEWLTDLDKDFGDLQKTLESINGKLTFIVIIIIIGIVVSLFRGCMGL